MDINYMATDPAADSCRQWVTFASLQMPSHTLDITSVFLQGQFQQLIHGGEHSAGVLH